MPYTVQRTHVCYSIIFPASEHLHTYLTSWRERAIDVKEYQLLRRAVRERLGDHVQCSLYMVCVVNTEQSRGCSQSPRWWTGGIYVVGRGGRRALAVISIINDARCDPAPRRARRTTAETSFASVSPHVYGRVLSQLAIARSTDMNTQQGLLHSTACNYRSNRKIQRERGKST